ncbi:E3 ubiquitin-protein ligase RNF144A-like [Heptranchias perlo]|uniref:E3 ubiquitin-protein ligase RNF144A-like n=1 Tax=Heptranchias perlo TaxID=212740 RepID=UPI00355979FF
MEIIVYEPASKRFQFVTAASLETGGHKASCGHLVRSKGLNEWCKALLNEGRFTFNCPKCAKEWPWQEVRQLARLSKGECGPCEEQLGRIMTPKAELYQKCPDCSLYVQRMDLEKLCVQCLPCSERSKKVFQFCWDCVREWKSTDVQSDSCGNESCSLTALLLGCSTIEDKASVVYGCPKVRACPNCEVLAEHCRKGCPSVLCPNCNHVFCYRCLELNGCHRERPAGLTLCPIVERQKLTGKMAYSKRRNLQDEDALRILAHNLRRLQSAERDAVRPEQQRNENSCVTF